MFDVLCCEHRSISLTWLDAIPDNVSTFLQTRVSQLKPLGKWPLGGGLSVQRKASLKFHYTDFFYDPRHEVKSLILTLTSHARTVGHGDVDSDIQGFVTYGLPPHCVQDSHDTQSDSKRAITQAHLLPPERKDGIASPIPFHLVGGCVHGAQTTLLCSSGIIEDLHPRSRFRMSSTGGYHVMMEWVHSKRKNGNKGDRGYYADVTVGNILHNATTIRNGTYRWYRRGSGNTPEDTVGPYKGKFRPMKFSSAILEHHWSRLRAKLDGGHVGIRDVVMASDFEFARMVEELDKFSPLDADAEDFIYLHEWMLEDDADSLTVAAKWFHAETQGYKDTDECIALLEQVPALLQALPAFWDQDHEEVIDAHCDVNLNGSPPTLPTQKQRPWLGFRIYVYFPNSVLSFNIQICMLRPSSS